MRFTRPLHGRDLPSEVSEEEGVLALCEAAGVARLELLAVDTREAEVAAHEGGCLLQVDVTMPDHDADIGGVIDLPC